MSGNGDIALVREEPIRKPLPLKEIQIRGTSGGQHIQGGSLYIGDWDTGNWIYIHRQPGLKQNAGTGIYMKPAAVREWIEALQELVDQIEGK